VFAFGFCRRSLFLPALRKEKTLYAYGVIGIAFGFALRPFLQGNMDHIVHEYKWKLIVILIPALFLALLYDILNRKLSGFLDRLLGTAPYDACKRKISASLGQLLGALGNSVLILAGMLASILLSAALFDRQFAPYQLLPPLLVLYCCLMMSDIIARIIGGELNE
jgi:small neutral amino acid transporter SnatA (MarC family)